MPGRAFLLPAAAALLALGCEPNAVTPVQRVDDRLGVVVPGAHQTVLRLSMSGFTGPAQLLVGDSVTWQSIWNLAWSGAPPTPKPPVDFVLLSVLVVGLGPVGVAADSVTLDSLLYRTGGIEVFATESRPGTACQPPGPAASPVHMVVIAEHPPILDWHIRTVWRSC